MICYFLHHQRYLNKKKTAEEMVQHYEKSSSVDYSLKEGETLVLQLKNVSFHVSYFGGQTRDWWCEIVSVGLHDVIVVLLAQY